MNIHQLRYMLDTNICIYVMKRRPLEILNIFNQNEGALCVSMITVAELFYGAENSAFPERNQRVAENFLSRLTVLPYDMPAAIHFGKICADLKRKGKLISENDMHIAAHARSENLILVSNNMREFERIEGLKLENWV